MMMNSETEHIKILLQEHPGILCAILFGSFVKGNTRMESDVDVAVLADHRLDAREKMLLIGQIASVTGRPVDLVDLSNVGEPLLGQILREGERILGDDTVFASLISKHVYNHADFYPYQQRIHRKRRGAWIGS